LLGLAIGTRLSFAPLVAPLLAAALLAPGAAAPARRRLGLAFLVGLVLALVPCLIVFGLAPEQFVFGNLTYAGLNTAYREQTSFPLAMTPLDKLAYVARTVVEPPGTLLLIVAWLVVAAPTVARGVLDGRSFGLQSDDCLEFERTFGSVLVAGSLPFVLVGALAPTPSFYQYFYPLSPFLALGLIYGLAGSRGSGDADRLALRGLAVGLLVTGVYAAPSYARLLRPPSSWAPLAEHALGVEVARQVGGGRVLTLAPLIPLEGGSPIYAPLATGPFAWRTAPEVDADRRDRLGMLTWAELAPRLDRAPPAGVLVGFEPDLEAPLVDFAVAHGYRETRLSGGASLWVRP
jgi:hypothetical protein